MIAGTGNSVIEFPLERVRPATAREPFDRSAEVVIFTGVRIERLTGDGESVPKARSGLSRKGRSGRR
jgi:hypothetical protein